jgi:CRISPR-associated endoribonuclease Cas6
MFLDEHLAKLHKENTFKHYVFDSFSPVQKDGIYKEDNIYTFRIRSFDKDFIDKMAFLIKKAKSELFDVKIVEKRIIKQRFLTKLMSITPTIVTFKNDNDKLYHWTLEKSGDIMKLYNALQNNLLKKYENFFNEKLEPEQNFIQLLEIKNQKPQTVNYKGIRLFGNKFLIVPNEDEVSQKLAFTAIACGLGEKNSVGCGFCKGERGERYD